MKTLFVILTLSANLVWAGNPGASRCESEQEVAEEVVRAELSGQRLPGPTSSCLNQNDFQHISVNNYGINEIIDSNPTILQRHPIKVRVYKTTPDNHPLGMRSHRRADYSQIVNGREVKIGTLYFTLRKPGTPLHATQGCAVAWSFPKKIHVFSDCLSGKK